MIKFSRLLVGSIFLFSVFSSYAQNVGGIDFGSLEESVPKEGPKVEPKVEQPVKPKNEAPSTSGEHTVYFDKGSSSLKPKTDSVPKQPVVKAAPVDSQVTLSPFTSEELMQAEGDSVTLTPEEIEQMKVDVVIESVKFAFVEGALGVSVSTFGGIQVVKAILQNMKNNKTLSPYYAALLEVQTLLDLKFSEMKGIPNYELPTKNVPADIKALFTDQRLSKAAKVALAKEYLTNKVGTEIEGLKNTLESIKTELVAKKSSFKSLAPNFIGGIVMLGLGGMTIYHAWTSVTSLENASIDENTAWQHLGVEALEGDQALREAVTKLSKTQRNIFNTFFAEAFIMTGLQNNLFVEENKG